MAFDQTYLYRMGEMGNGNTLWSYMTADAITTVRGGGYIDSADDAFDQIRLGDVFLVSVRSDPSAGPAASSAVQLMTVVAKTASAIDLSDGTAIAVTNT